MLCNFMGPLACLLRCIWSLSEFSVLLWAAKASLLIPGVRAAGEGCAWLLLAHRVGRKQPSFVCWAGSWHVIVLFSGVTCIYDGICIYKQTNKQSKSALNKNNTYPLWLFVSVITTWEPVEFHQRSHCFQVKNSSKKSRLFSYTACSPASVPCKFKRPLPFLPCNTV